eukprot:7266473-Pyramimonas_sp.AAC.1
MMRRPGIADSSAMSDLCTSASRESAADRATRAARCLGISHRDRAKWAHPAAIPPSYPRGL